MATRHAVSVLVAVLAFAAAVRAQSGGLLNTGLGTNGNVANAGTGLLGGATGNVAQVGGCAAGLVALCVAGVCSCVLPGAGVGDPVLQDFAGNRFEFFGEPGSCYALYSDYTHQVNMQLFEGFVDGHEGTYMEAFGLAFHQFRVNVSLTNECDMAVQAWQEQSDKEKLSVMVSEEPSTFRLVDEGSNSLAVDTEPFRPWAGRTVRITTGNLEMSIWAVPAGTVDSLNVSQPAYLNFNLTLLAPPPGDASEGIIGESLKGAVLEIFGKTYNIFAESISAKKPAEQHVFDGKGLTNDYRVDGLFGTEFEYNLFGKQEAAASVSRRAMLHLAGRFAALGFPLQSSSARA